LAEHSEVKSENSQNVILSYGENVYLVSRVNVEVSEVAEKLRAIFHVRRLPDNAQEDLNIEINQHFYDMLTEYAKMDKLDLILVLQIQGDKAKWCLMSENWLKNQAASWVKTCFPEGCGDFTPREQRALRQLLSSSRPYVCEIVVLL
jgi:hypothetical protein